NTLRLGRRPFVAHCALLSVVPGLTADPRPSPPDSVAANPTKAPLRRQTPLARCGRVQFPRRRTVRGGQRAAGVGSRAMDATAILLANLAEIYDQLRKLRDTGGLT